MNTESTLNRFLDAQAADYQSALAEISNGSKTGHWMWYIFPQVQGLGFSKISRFYALRDLQEAQDYFDHPILGHRLVEISTVLFELKSNDAFKIFGNPDELKLNSCMTLFSSLVHTHPIFQQVIDKFFEGSKDEKTLTLIFK